METQKEMEGSLKLADQLLVEDYNRFRIKAFAIWVNEFGNDKDDFQTDFMEWRVEDSVGQDLMTKKAAQDKTVSADFWVDRLIENIWAYIGKSPYPPFLPEHTTDLAPVQ